MDANHDSNGSLQDAGHETSKVSEEDAITKPVEVGKDDTPKNTKKDEGEIVNSEQGKEINEQHEPTIPQAKDAVETQDNGEHKQEKEEGEKVNQQDEKQDKEEETNKGHKENEKDKKEEKDEKEKKEEKGEDNEPEKEYSDHLLVLQHGLHGNERDFDYVKAQMEKQYKGLRVHAAASNGSFLKTQDGIENAGNRLAKEILDLIAKLPQVTKLSIIGHSLGGIIGRYAVGKLYEAKLFDKVKPVVFMTIATPNVGSRRPMRGAFNKLVSQVTSRLLQRTGMELMLEDETPEGVPLLVLLARKGTSFMKGLELFETRILYSNVKSDVTVPYCTAAIVHKNPYKGEKARKITLSKKYPHIIEYEEKEETTLEVDKGDLKDIKDELLGDAEVSASKEDLLAQQDAWKYGGGDENNNNTTNNDKPADSNGTNDSTNIDTSTISTATTSTLTTTSTNPTSIATTSTSTTSTVTTTSTPTSNSTPTSSPNSKRAGTTDSGNKGPALSEETGADAKNASIPKETIIEKLFEKDSKGNHLMEILTSLQSLKWKRYDVYFETWFLAHTHVVVKRAWINTAGSDVVRHIVDNFTP